MSKKCKNSRNEKLGPKLWHGRTVKTRKLSNSAQKWGWRRPNLLSFIIPNGCRDCVPTSLCLPIYYYKRHNIILLYTYTTCVSSNPSPSADILQFSSLVIHRNFDARVGLDVNNGNHLQDHLASDKLASRRRLGHVCTWTWWFLDGFYVIIKYYSA